MLVCADLTSPGHRSLVATDEGRARVAVRVFHGRRSAPVNSDQRKEQLVAPFYLQMMRENARENGPRLLPQLAAAGRTATAQDVESLLVGHWRAKVMGAWFALLQDDEGVTASVLEALRSSLGSLDSPPLATAAVVLAGQHALPFLLEYAARDAENAWGACGFVAAAIEHIGGSCATCPPGEGDSAAFAELLALALHLRDLRED